MGTIIYYTIRLAAAVYLLYRVYVILFRRGCYGLWDRIPLRQVTAPAQEIKPHRLRLKNVVGKADAIYIEDPAAVKATESETESMSIVDLEPYPDPEPEDIEVIDIYIPSADEIDYPEDEGIASEVDFSSGCTFEQLREALGYMAAPTDDEGERGRTAETLAAIRNTDVFGFIENQVAGAEAVGRLLSEYFDEPDMVMPARNSNLNETVPGKFDIDRYV